MRKLILISVLFVMIANLSFFNLQGNEKSNAIAVFNAKKDANEKTSGLLWFGTGFLFSFLGVAASYIIAPSPVTSQFTGKSPDYTKKYIENYKKFSKGKQNKFAWMGCTTSGIIYTIIFIYTTANSIGESISASCGDAFGDACANSISTGCTNSDCSYIFINPLSINLIRLFLFR